MKIKKNCWVEFEYQIKDLNGHLLEQSTQNKYNTYIHGYGQILPVLEEALEGKKEGEALSIILNPEQAYGKRNEKLVYQLNKSHFENFNDLEVGGQLILENKSGEKISLKISQINQDHLIADGNHPYAGMELKYKIQITKVRKAQPQELKKII